MMMRPKTRSRLLLALGLALLVTLPARADAPPPKFAAADAALKPPRPDEVRIVFIGDSVTSGWISPLPEKVGDTVRIGRGIAGQTSADVRARFAADALALHPGVVHILVGTNDIAGNGGPITLDDTRANLAAMAADAKAAGARVILSTLLPCTDYYWHRGQQPAPKIAEINAWIRQEAAAKGYVLADYFTPMAAPDASLKAEYSRDGTHPNEAGHKVMAGIAEAAITAARNLPQ